MLEMLIKVESLFKKINYKYNFAGSSHNYSKSKFQTFKTDSQELYRCKTVSKHLTQLEQVTYLVGCKEVSLSSIIMNQELLYRASNALTTMHKMAP